MRVTKKMGKNMARKKSLKVKPPRFRNRRCGRVGRKTKRIVGKKGRRNASRKIRETKRRRMRGGAGAECKRRKDAVGQPLLLFFGQHLKRKQAPRKETNTKPPQKTQQTTTTTTRPLLPPPVPPCFNPLHAPFYTLRCTGSNITLCSGRTSRPRKSP